MDDRTAFVSVGEAIQRALAAVSADKPLPIWRTAPGHEGGAAEGKAWCWRCRQWHGHGYAPGHRTPHCVDAFASRLPDYRLSLQGDAPPVLLRDMTKNRPAGPVLLGVRVQL